MPQEGNVHRPARPHGRSGEVPRSSAGASKEDSVVALSFRFRKEVHDKLRVYCFVKGVSQNEFVATAVEECLKNVMEGLMEKPIASLLNA
jgi:hypothetical protein